eukprot:1605234-Prymnesium_polylepis.1
MPAPPPHTCPSALFRCGALPMLRPPSIAALEPSALGVPLLVGCFSPPLHTCAAHAAEAEALLLLAWAASGDRHPDLGRGEPARV